LRAVDILSRFGGEEFLILLPSTNQEEAYLIAERLRKTVAGSPFTTENLSIPITISSGVAVIKEKNATLSDLISHADKAMYQSKKSGRNCVSVYGLPDKN
jgi:diguanylate cyclase (GGDEF)-like protein